MSDELIGETPQQKRDRERKEQHERVDNAAKAGFERAIHSGQPGGVAPETVDPAPAQDSGEPKSAHVRHENATYKNIDKDGGEPNDGG